MKSLLRHKAVQYHHHVAEVRGASRLTLFLTETLQSTINSRLNAAHQPPKNTKT